MVVRHPAPRVLLCGTAATLICRVLARACSRRLLFNLDRDEKFANVHCCTCIRTQSRNTVLSCTSIYLPVFLPCCSQECWCPVRDHGVRNPFLTPINCGSTNSTSVSPCQASKVRCCVEIHCPPARWPAPYPSLSSGCTNKSACAAQTSTHETDR